MLSPRARAVGQLSPRLGAFVHLTLTTTLLLACATNEAPRTSTAALTDYIAANKPKQGIDGVTIVTVDRVGQALAALRE